MPHNFSRQSTWNHFLLEEDILSARMQALAVHAVLLLAVLFAWGSPVSGVTPVVLRCGARPVEIRLSLRGGGPHVIPEAGEPSGEFEEDDEMDDAGGEEEEDWTHKGAPMLFAAAAGDVAELKKQIAAGADVNRVTRKKGEAPLHVAAKRGHLEVRGCTRVAKTRCDHVCPSAPLGVGPFSVGARLARLLGLERRALHAPASAQAAATAGE